MSLDFISIVVKTKKFKQECDISLCMEKMCKGIIHVYINLKCMLCRAYSTIYLIRDYKSWKRVGGKSQ